MVHTPLEDVTSAPPEEITSEGLGEFKRLIEQAKDERQCAERALPFARDELWEAEARLRRAEHWFFGLVLRRKVPALRAAAEEKSREVAELEARLDGVFVEAACDLEPSAQAKFEKLTAAFEELAAVTESGTLRRGRISID